MKAMKQILVAASLVVISATAPVVEAQQGPKKAATEANTVKADLPKIDESLHGTEYVNRTGKFSLTLPPEWIINADLRHRPVTLAGLSSSDKTRFAIVEQREYPGSLTRLQRVEHGSREDHFEQFRRTLAVQRYHRRKESDPRPLSWKHSSTAQHICRICHRIHQQLGQQFHKSHCLVRGVVISRYAARIRKLVTSYHSSPRLAVAGDR